MTGADTATITSSVSSNKLASSHAECEHLDAKVCEHSLRKVFSWLDVPELMGSAALVSQRWAAAAGCKEVFRRRMHRSVLDTLFNPQHIKTHTANKAQQQQQQQPDDDMSNNSADQQQQFTTADTTTNSTTTSSSSTTSSFDSAAAADGEHCIDPTAAAIAAIAAAGIAPARLFAAVYDSNLLANGSFLERLNTHSPSGAQGHSRRLVWEPTLNPRGTTWAHPFDFFPELCPLPEAPPGFSRGSRSAPLKPFSIGCLATSSGVWSEVVQVVDLQSVLVSSGLPEPTAAWLLAAAGLPLEFTVQVAGGAAAGGEYQVVMTLVAAEDAAAAAAAVAAAGGAANAAAAVAAAPNAIPLSALPKLSLPFGHPPAGCPGIDAVSAAQLRARGFSRGTKNLTRAPLHPPPGVWTSYSCRTVLPRDTPISHVVIALRGRASRNTRLGHYATKFADARLCFLSADQ